MINVNPEILEQIVETAKQRTGGDAAWCNAISRAALEIESNPYLHMQGAELLVMSSTSNEIYRANGSCQCKAFEFGRACWHRALYRLLKLYEEAVELAATVSTIEPRKALVVPAILLSVRHGQLYCGAIAI